MRDKSVTAIVEANKANAPGVEVKAFVAAKVWTIPVMDVMAPLVVRRATYVL